VCEKVINFLGWLWGIILNNLLKIIIGMAILIICIVTFLFIKYVVFNESISWLILHNTDRLSNFGAIGDYFGGLLNPTFAFFALILLLHTIKIQSKELKASTEALKQQAKISKDQLDASNTQINHSKIEHFESTFFNLLQIHHQNVMSIEVLFLDNFKDKKGVYVLAEINTIIHQYYNDEFNKVISEIIIDCCPDTIKHKDIKSILNFIDQMYYQHIESYSGDKDSIPEKIKVNINNFENFKSITQFIKVDKLVEEHYSSPVVVAQKIYNEVNSKLDNHIKNAMISYLRSLDIVIQYINNDKNAQKYLEILFSSLSVYEIEIIYHLLPLFEMERDNFNVEENVKNIKTILKKYGENKFLVSRPIGFLHKPIQEHLIKPFDEIVSK